MKNVLFLTKYPSPYRVEFFNLLGKSVNLTVLFEQSPTEQTHRNQSWFNTDYSNFKAVFLKYRSVAGRKHYSDLKKYLSSDYDIIVICGYAMPAEMAAIDYLKRHNISYYMEVDGIVDKPTSKLKAAIKKHYIKGATGYFSSGKSADDSLLKYGAQKSEIIRYNFSSLRKSDILSRLPSQDEKAELRYLLGITEEKVIISVGQFIPRKGFDLLIESAKSFDDTGFYIIGGIADELTEKSAGRNVHFIDYQSKDEIFRWFKAADCYVCPSRYDIWGLVVNEAMANGLPVIGSDKTGAALELIKDDYNGYVFCSGSPQSLTKMIKKLFVDETSIKKMAENSLKAICEYTIENMVSVHLNTFGV